MPEFYDINRSALILRPSKAMIDWLRLLFPESAVEYAESLSHDDLDVFLIPSFAKVEESEAWLQENFEDFLVNTLEEWCADEAAWPKPLDWALFQRFINYSVHSVVVDTLDEDYDDEFEDEEWN